MQSVEFDSLADYGVPVGLYKLSLDERGKLPKT